jgi:type II secretory pathway component GspD/PulD (secretin)
MKTNLQSPVLTKVLASALALCGFSTYAQVIQQQTSVTTIQPSIQQVESGPILDVVPYVLSDGYTINLTLIPSLTEFSGYAPQPDFLAGFGSSGLNAIVAPAALPTFSVREVVTTVNIWDHQTVVLGGLISSTISSEKDKVPVLGDLPLVGRAFQSQQKTTTKKNLMIFVTATLVDPAGNLVHSDDELPFAQNNIPPQPPPAPGQIQAGQVTPPATIQ